MSKKQRILFVCTANQQRSPTAERLYEGDPRFEVRSAGTHATRERAVTREILEWADMVVVMEERHAAAIRREFPELSSRLDLQILHIPDIYQYMDTRLQQEIRNRFEALLSA
jgi:predicted protein tyrosine phosphatase